MNEYTTGATYDDGKTLVLWGTPSRRYYIIADGYGLGLSDGWTVDRPIIYDDRRVAYEWPERLPQYVKRRFETMAARGLIENRMEITA